jgi:hypothetical protein
MTVVYFEGFASWLHFGSFIIKCDCAFIQKHTTAELGNIETRAIGEIHKLSKCIFFYLWVKNLSKMEKKRGYELI